MACAAVHRTTESCIASCAQRVRVSDLPSKSGQFSKVTWIPTMRRRMRGPAFAALALFVTLFRGCSAARAIEIPEVAVCISGAVRSFATVPVLRSLKNHILHSTAYSTAAFAALSYDTASPQLLEYNDSLTKRLALPTTVRRALGHLRPYLQAAAFYNTTSAVERFRSCRPTDTRRQLTSTDVPALYGMQARSASPRRAPCPDRALTERIVLCAALLFTRSTI